MKCYTLQHINLMVHLHILTRGFMKSGDGFVVVQRSIGSSGVIQNAGIIKSMCYFMTYVKKSEIQFHIDRGRLNKCNYSFRHSYLRLFEKYFLPTANPNDPRAKDIGSLQKSGGCSIPIGTTILLAAWLQNALAVIIFANLPFQFLFLNGEK